MSHGQITKAVTIVCAAAAFVVPVAQADPPQGHRGPTSTLRPDGYQPQLRISDGAVSAPDNAIRSLPRERTLPVVATGTVSDGFDWVDGGVGAATGALLFLLASGAVVFARNRRLAHS